MTARAVRTPVAFVDDGLGNSSYIVDLGDGRGLVADPDGNEVDLGGSGCGSRHPGTHPSTSRTSCSMVPRRSHFLTLPDDLPIYPTHSAGSFCSAPAGGERTTTIGRERRANPLLGDAVDPVSQS